MKKVFLQVPDETLIQDYLTLGSSYRVAEKHQTSATAVKRILKELGVLKDKSDAARLRNISHPEFGRYKRTKRHRNILSKCAEQRVGEKNTFFGRTHTEDTKRKIGSYSKLRTAERNPNYKDGSYQRRPKDYELSKFQPLRRMAFERDNFTCHYCKVRGGKLHAHHILPYWIAPKAYLDAENLITVCETCHFSKAHLGNTHKFDVSLASDQLLARYCVNRNDVKTMNNENNYINATLLEDITYNNYQQELTIPKGTIIKVDTKEDKAIVPNGDKITISEGEYIPGYIH